MSFGIKLIEMENNIENTDYKKDYNTKRERLVLPEHGRHVQKMLEHVMEIEDPEKRKEQLQCVVDVMRSLEGVGKDNQEAIQKLWDHLQVISGYRLKDEDSPFPLPHKESENMRPSPIVRNATPIKATHYGRNIESIIDMIAGKPDDDARTAMIRSLAIYMRRQYLIWNKDSVADETIFRDIERMSGGRIKVPEDMVLTKISADAVFSRPGVVQPNKKKNLPNQKKGKQLNNRRRNA